ncbi:MAG: M99 family carboxypeptidase catalytic domain-containing protein [Pseudomonadota bacterium]
MNRFLTVLLCVLLLNTANAFANDLEFTLHKITSEIEGPTLLVIGGIQGDEPGGFTAASMLVTDYAVTKGEVWVVPNLNFESIIKRSRGVHGDMNRKFSEISNSDPEFQTIEKIKSIILHEQVDLVLNLHDGSGFYNPTYIDKDENPKRWGQCIVIDQDAIRVQPYGNMASLANRAIARANVHTEDSKAAFRLKNTYTSDGNKEMAKTLTYFAIQNDKPAMGVEASKAYPTHKRILQHLRFVEAMMDEIGVEYARSFELSGKSIKNKLGRDIKLAMYNEKILFDFGQARKKIRFVPMKKRAPVMFKTNNPLVAIVDHDSQYKVRYGNRSVTTLDPEYFEYDYSLTNAEFVIDGQAFEVELGTSVKVRNDFSVTPMDGRRINIIGYRHPEKRNESGLTVKRSQISSRFSVDKDGDKYRVEFYKGKYYSGMVLVEFSRINQKSATSAKTNLVQLN